MENPSTAAALAGPSSLNLIATTSQDVFNPNTCIICQEETKVPVTSEKTWRAKMKQAAEIRIDVAKCIKSMNTDSDKNDVDADECLFVYHNTNKCYKSYTHSVKLKSIEEKNAKARTNQTEETLQKYWT